MPEPSDPSKFRANATLAYRFACVVLVLAVIGAGWLGWYLGHWKGLTIGAVVGVVVAGVVWFGITFLWAMTQDGG